MPTIDFTDVPDLKPLEPGVYEAYIEKAEEGTSKTGNAKIDIQWKVTDGAGVERTIFDTLSFHPKALFRTKKVLRALGFAEGFSGEVDAETLAGLQAMITIAIEPSNGADESGEPYPERNRVIKVAHAV